MDTWTTVIVAAIVAFASIFSTFMSNRQHGKRFKEELERVRETDYHQRRREVRGEPLLKLRAELARMVSKQNRLVDAAHKQHTRSGFTDEEVQVLLREAIDDWNNYVRGGEWLQTLFTLDDAELIDRLGSILKDYTDSYVSAMYFKELSATEIGKAMEVFERNKVRIIEVQELINKRLEEL